MWEVLNARISAVIDNQKGTSKALAETGAASSSGTLGVGARESHVFGPGRYNVVKFSTAALPPLPPPLFCWRSSRP